MKKAFFLVGIAIFFAVVSLTMQTETAYARTDHCGTIGSETWTGSGNVHVITCDVTVASGSTLTIEEGAIIKVDSDDSMIVNGTLRVLGTSGNHVSFTSMKDDTIGGDTNGDGAATSPNRGDWESIRFNDSSDDANSLIEYADIYYAGEYYNDYAAIRLNNASPTVRYATISSSAGNAIGATLCSFPVLTGNTFSNNGINGLGLDGGTVCNGAVWGMTNTAYYLHGDVTVNANEMLTVNPGVVMKFGGDSSIIVKGTLKVLGLSTKKVYFTSGRDDTLKGDTNGDGGASSPYPGDWESIRFEDSSNDANSLIKYAVIRYGGEYYNDNAAIRLNSASPTLRFTTVELNRSGIAANNSKPKVRCNNIISNQELGIRNETTGVMIKAENNWWGATSGPYHAGTNPSGAGNPVTDGVDYKPWLVKPFTDPCIDLIFVDGFESGTFTNWSSKVVDGGDLSVTTAAKLIGQFGMKANIDDTAAIYVTDDNPISEKEYWARFYFDPNAITMADGNAHSLFLGYSGTTVMNFRIEFRRSAGEYQLQIGAIGDNGAWQNSGWTKLGNYGDTTRHIIEINWNAASGVGTNDGSMKLWIDEVDSRTITGLDNDTRKVDRVRLGAVDGIDSGTHGVYFFDAFESRRSSYIGPVSLEELEDALLPAVEDQESEATGSTAPN